MTPGVSMLYQAKEREGCQRGRSERNGTTRWGDGWAEREGGRKAKLEKEAKY